MKSIRVGITSIGSGVGQAVVNSCRLSGMPLYLIGYGNNPFAYGSFDCDERKLLPSIYAPEYADELFEACVKDAIDMLIPGLDDELLLLARHAERFGRAGVRVVVSGEPMLELCRDKALMWRELSKVTAAFVRGYTRSSLLLEAEAGRLRYPMIAKPVSGFASRGIFVIRNEADLAGVTDAHVVQEVATPNAADPNRDHFLRALNNGEILQAAEISAQILIGRNGSQLGRFLGYHKLNNGVPVQIIPLDAPEVWSELDRLLPLFRKAGLFGPLNLQGRLTDEGPRFFEMNARFTGISGLRALSGFNEVAAVIADLRGCPPPVLRQNPRKIGMRQVADRVVDIDADRRMADLAESTGRYPRRGRRILVTGANGYLGRALLEALLADADLDSVVAMVRNPERFGEGCEAPLPAEVELADASMLFTGGFEMGGVDVICHVASGRPHHSAAELAECLRFTQALVEHAVRYQVPGFINASSQAVYGTSRPPLWTEELPPAPETAFAQSKWASELMVESIPKFNPASRACSLRFAQLIGPSPVRDSARLVHKYAEAALSGDDLQVMGGRQQLDFLDLRDAAELVRLLAVAPFTAWPGVLNAGSGQPLSVLEVADCVARVADDSGLGRPVVEVNPDFSAPDFGMSRERAFQVFGWTPLRPLEQTIRDIFEEHRAGVLKKRTEA